MRFAFINGNAYSDRYSHPLPPSTILIPRVGRGLGQSSPGSLSLEAQTAAVGSAVAAGLSFIPGVGWMAAGAAAAATQLAVVFEKLFSGCGDTCVISSNLANQVGDIMAQSLRTYLSYPVRTKSMQAYYLQIFDNAWAKLEQACGSPTLGDAGRRCISDRQQGACKWQSSPGGWQQDAAGNWNFVWPGPAGSGTACWNYFVGMRDPIANDPTVIPDPSSTTTTAGANPGTTAGVMGGGGSTSAGAAAAPLNIPMPLLLLAAGIAVLAAL